MKLKQRNQEIQCLYTTDEASCPSQLDNVKIYYDDSSGGGGGGGGGGVVRPGCYFLYVCYELCGCN